MTTRVDTTSIETYLGRYLDFNNPRPEDIELADIARGLAHTCRFAGHTTRFYSVAEHAVLVAKLVVDAGHPELELAALHHDSHEAYLGDWPTPLKRAIGMGRLQQLQESLDRAICKRYDIRMVDMHQKVVKNADVRALLAEAATLKPSRGVGVHWGNDAAVAPIAGAGMPPEYAERLFVDAHERAMCK